MVTKRTYAPRAGRAKTWIFIGLAGIVLLVIAAMVIGIVTNSHSDSLGPAATDFYSQPGEQGRLADNKAAFATSAPAPTAVASYASGAAAPAVAGSNRQTNTASTTGQTLPADRLIIRNATISLTSSDVDKTLLDVRALASEKSGVVFQSSSTVRNDKTYATITIQVPATAFDDTLNRIRKLSGVKVENENSTSQDVTEEFVDVQAQLKNLQATEAELLQLLGKANSVSDVLTVQRELSNVRGQIEQRQGRINYLQKKTDMSSITLTIAPTGIATSPDTGWDVGKVFDTAWAGSLRGLQGLFTVVVTVGVWAIWAVPLLGLFIFLVVFAFRRMFPKRSQGTPPPSAGSNPPAPTAPPAPPAPGEGLAA